MKRKPSRVTLLKNIVCDGKYHDRKELMEICNIKKEYDFTNCLFHLRRQGLRFNVVRNRNSKIIELRYIGSKTKHNHLLPCFIPLNQIKVCSGKGCYHRFRCPAVQVYNEKREHIRLPLS